MKQAGNPVFIEAFFTESTIERFNDSADQAGIFYSMTVGNHDPVAVVGDDDSEATRTIFHLNSKDVEKLLTSAVTPLTTEQIPSRILWIIELGDNPLDASLGGQLVYDMPGYKIWHVGTNGIDTDFTAPIWPDVESLRGVSGAEAFGRWSDGKTASILFKHDIPINATLTVSAAAFAQNAGKPFEVKIGDPVQQFTLGSNETSTTLTFRNLSQHTHEMTIYCA